MELDTYVTKSTQHSPILDSHYLLKEDICVILKKMIKTKQRFYAIYIQPLIKVIILDKAPHILEGTHTTVFKASYEWTKHFVKGEL